MDNSKLTPGEHVASLRRLWKECFNDTDEFIDMYFTRIYSPQVDYSIERDGRVVSALQCLPYNMLCGGNTVLAGYLSGVCTDASYRRQAPPRLHIRIPHPFGQRSASLLPAIRLLHRHTQKCNANTA